MKSKKFAAIIGFMIFGMTLLTGAAVMAVLYFANIADDAGRTTAPNQPDDATDTITPVETDLSLVLLWDGANQTVHQLNTDTDVLTPYPINPNPDGFHIGLPRISPDGRLIAFCQATRLSDEQVSYALVVRELLAARNSMTIDFGTIAGCEAGVFNADGTQVTVGVVYNNPIMNAENFPDMPDWAIHLYDIPSGTVAQAFDADNPSAPDFAALDDAYWFEPNISPMLRSVAFIGEDVYLTAFPFVGRDSAFVNPAYRWNVTANTFTFVDGLTRIGADVLPSTDEIVYPYLDDAYPVAQPPGPSPRANSIQVEDANGTQRTIYRNTNENILRTLFVNGGDAVLAMLVPDFDPQNPETAGESRYILVDRAGNVTDVEGGLPFYDRAHGTGTGFVTLYVDSYTIPNPSVTMVAYDSTTAQSTELWVYTPDNITRNLMLLWVPPMQNRADLPTFTVLN